MRCFVMFVTAVCVLFLLKLKWPKNKSFYDKVKVFLLLLIYVFNIDLFEFSAAILEKGPAISLVFVYQ